MSNKFWSIPSLFILGVFLVPLAFLSANSLAQTQDLIPVEGRVLEASTSHPIVNATVAFWSGQTLNFTVRTDFEGRYETMLDGGLKYTVYVYADDPYTLGVDYVPQILPNLLGQNFENFTFTLMPAASILIGGELLFLNASEPPVAFSFEVKDPQSEVTLHLDDYFFIYGTSPYSHNSYLSLDARHVIVPAESAVNIEVTSRFRVETSAPERRSMWSRAPVYSYVSRTFTLDQAGHFNLSQGQQLSVDIRHYSLPLDLTLVEDSISGLTSQLDEIQQKGFYTVTERVDLSRITGLAEVARSKLDLGLYGACYADLREAYIQALNLSGRLGWIITDAKTSTAILVFFLAFTATAIAYFFFDGRTQKVMAMCILYVALLIMLYVVYLGCRLVPPILFFGAAIISLGFALFVAQLLPGIFKEKAIQAGISFRSALVVLFSMAKRSLRRRSFRTGLTLIIVTILVMSFVVLASSSTEYGLVIKPQPPLTSPSDGLLLRRPPVEIIVYGMEAGTFSVPLYSYTIFGSIDASDVEWLKGISEIGLVAPKVENPHSRYPIGHLENLDLWGYLGIVPSVEEKINYINETVLEGRFLRDDDVNKILISTEAMRKLSVDVGDTLSLRIGFSTLDVELVGVFDDNRLAQLREQDGTSILPKKLVIESKADVLTAHTPSCDPSEIVITSLTTINGLENNGVTISRINVLVKDPETILSLARRIALERDYVVWAVLEGEVHLMYVGSFWEFKGLSLLIPWGIVFLNMVVAMLNSLWERRHEISILSAVGLNPTHITGLFVAEATIIAVIGGGIGYLLGLSWYPLMSSLSIVLEVQQKVSAVWCLSAIGIAMTAVLMGALTALKTSVIVTPSLLRRWRAEPRTFGKPWTLTIPISVPPSEINAFMQYLHRSLKASTKSIYLPRVEWVKNIEEMETSHTTVKRINFVYRLEQISLANKFTTNLLEATKKKGEDVFTIQLISKGDEKKIYDTASFVREIVLEWSVTGT